MMMMMMMMIGFLTENETCLVDFFYFQTNSHPWRVVLQSYLSRTVTLQFHLFWAFGLLAWDFNKAARQ